MKKLFPDFNIIEDIGSGINFNRKGISKIIDLSISGKINKIVVAIKNNYHYSYFLKIIITDD